MGRCIVYTGIRLLLLIHPFISSFFFLSNFQTLKFFVKLFSGTKRPRRLKLGTHMDSGQMYSVYRKRLLLPICPFISSFFFLSNFQTLKFFITLFSGTMGPRMLKLGTHMDSGQMYRAYQTQVAVAYSSLYFFSFLSLQFSNIKNVCCAFLRNCEAYKVETWYTHGDWVDVSCIPQSGCYFLFVPYFFIFLSLLCSKIKNFRHTFLRNCEAKIVQTWYTCRQWVDVSCIPESGCCRLLVPLFLHFSCAPIIKH